jgi:hypothetical protein
MREPIHSLLEDLEMRFVQVCKLVQQHRVQFVVVCLQHFGHRRQYLLQRVEVQPNLQLVKPNAENGLGNSDFDIV